MSLLMKFPEILKESRALYESWKAGENIPEMREVERAGVPGESPANRLILGDNADCMRWILANPEQFGKLKLIYIDPPFYTRTDYGTELKLRLEKTEKIPAIKQKAYHDTWENGMEEYLKMLGSRLYLMRDLLAEDGCLWVHLDWHAVHYVKVLLDEIFGESNFINEIVWQYKSGGVSHRTFAKKHDTLLFYGKSKKYYFAPQKEKSYNRGLKPYRFKGVKEYRDETGWYTLVNRKDVWQIDMVGRTSAERTGYATQKPEALLERILESCTKEGDLCGDFFGGSGTLAATAHKMGRRWICCDLGMLAVGNAYRRMALKNASFLVCEMGDAKIPENRLQAKAEISATLQRDALSGKVLLRMEIKEFSPDIAGELPVDEKYRETIQRAAKTDPMQFLSCWSVDCDYNGVLHRPQVCYCRENGDLRTEYMTMGDDFSSVSVRMLDLFGRSIFLVLTPQWNIAEE